jgi:putative redox protein
MTAPAHAKPVITTSRAVWVGDHQFDAGPEGRTAPVDGDSKTAPGPVETLLNAIATCASVDVIDILAKRRTPVERFVASVTATRRTEAPRRVMHLELEFEIEGAGITVDHAERAIELSFEKYCSVAGSLAPDIVAETVLVLNGSRQSPHRRKIWSPEA